METVLPDGGAWALVKLAIALAAVAEGLALSLDWRGARRGAARLLQIRLDRPGRVAGWIIRPLLLLVGLLSLGFGAFEIVHTVQELV
jgi:hypothetical protein